MTVVSGRQVRTEFFRHFLMATIGQLRVVRCPGCKKHVAGTAADWARVWQCPLCGRQFRRRRGLFQASITSTDADRAGLAGQPQDAGDATNVRQPFSRRSRLEALGLGVYAALLVLLMVLYHGVMAALAAVSLVLSAPIVLWRALALDAEPETDEPRHASWLKPIADWFPRLWSGDADLTIGPVLTGDQAPGIFGIVAETARMVGAPEPDEIRVTHVPCCGVLEQRRWCGLRRGRRVLVVGLPVLYVLTIEELRAAVAHELAHLSGGDAAMAFVISQFVDSLDQSIARGSATRWRWVNPCVLFARIVRWLFSVLASPLSRHQEYRADRVAASACGSDVVARSLGLVALVQPVFKEVLCHYHPTVVPGVNLYQFFFAAWTALDAQQKCAMRDSLVAEERPHWFDPHPSLRLRLANLEQYPASAERDGRPALEILTDRHELETRLHNQLYRARTQPVSVFHPCGSY